MSMKEKKRQCAECSTHVRSSRFYLRVVSYLWVSVIPTSARRNPVAHIVVEG